MIKKIFGLLLFFTVLVSFSSFGSYAINIGTCGKLTVSTTYNMTANIIGSPLGVCMNVTAPDVILDCDGHTIDGTSIALSAAIYSDKFNTIIRNCVISDWDTGVYFQNNAEGGLYNSQIINTGSYGIALSNMSNQTLDSNILTNGSVGIWVSQGSNNSLVNNTHTNFSNSAIKVSSGSGNSFNNETINISSYGAYLVSFSSNNTFNNITVFGIAGSSYGIYFDTGSNNSLLNSAIYDNLYGIVLSAEYNDTLLNNIIQDNSVLDFYIIATVDSSCNHLVQNITGSNGLAINYTNESVTWGNFTASEIVLCNADSSTLSNITVNGSSTLNNNGILIRRTDNATINNSNSSNNYYGIYIIAGTGNSIGNNTFNLNTNGIELSSSQENFFSNNNLTGNTNPIIDGDILLYDQLGYENSFGSVLWNLSDLNLDPSTDLDIGNNLYIENNLVGLADIVGVGKLDNFALIQIKGLGYSLTPWLLKGGVRCDNNSAWCNIISYSGGILSANVSGFSNYTTQDVSSYCQTLNSNYTLNGDVNSIATCFTINASDITLDCNGYTINYSTSSAGYGINSSGFSGLSIRNCNITQGSTAQDSHAIYIYNGSSNSVDNVTTTVLGDTSECLYFNLTNSSNVTNSEFNLSDIAGYAISVSHGSLNNLIENDTIVTYGVSSGGLIIDSNSDNNTIKNSNITTYSAGGVGVLFSAVSDSFASNLNVTTNGAYDSHALVFSSSANNSVVEDSYFNSITSGKDIYSTLPEGYIAYVVNSSFDYSDVEASDAGRVYVGWLADVNVSNLSYLPIENSTVKSIKSSVINYQNSSDSNGMAELIVPWYVLNSTGITYLVPNEIRASKTGYASNYTTLSINETGNTNLTLLLGPSAGPSLSFSSDKNSVESGQSVAFSCSASHSSGMSSVAITIGSRSICSGTSSCSASFSPSSSISAVCTAVCNDEDSSQSTIRITVISSGPKGGPNPESAPAEPTSKSPQDYYNSDYKIKKIISSGRGKSTIIFDNASADFMLKDDKPVLDLNINISELIGNYSQPENVFISWFTYGIAIISFLVLLTFGSIGLEKAMSRYNEAEKAYLDLTSRFNMGKRLSFSAERKAKKVGAEITFIGNFLKNIVAKNGKRFVMPSYSLHEYRNELVKRTSQLSGEIGKTRKKELLIKIKALERLQDSIRDQLSGFDNRRIDKSIEELRSKLFGIK